jgi:hypothetical protein
MASSFEPHSSDQPVSKSYIADVGAHGQAGEISPWSTLPYFRVDPNVVPNPTVMMPGEHVADGLPAGPSQCTIIPKERRRKARCDQQGRSPSWSLSASS